MAQATNPPFTLAIIGSGIGGLALAIGLLKQNVHCIIFEAAARFDAVGAGIGLGPNALRAMELMDERFARMYDAVKVGNTSPERVHEQMEILSASEGFGVKVVEGGWKGGSVGHPRFTRSSAHRKALLEIMKSLIPEGTVRFNKRVAEVRPVGRKVVLEFGDGTSVDVDGVVGCDGIKGMSRGVVLGARYPEEVKAKYGHTYVYRGIVGMEEAKRLIGTYAEDARWFMSKGKGWAMYPITGGQEINMVAFMHDPNEWEGEQVAREVPIEEMEKEFEGFDSRLKRLLPHTKPFKWPLFHHPDTPTYINGRVCLLGDAAHASSPSQAAGAGQGLEDALILSKLLGLVTSADQLETAFQVYDVIRRPRAQKVVQDSLVVSSIYYFMHSRFGSDLKKITADANERLPQIWWYDLERDVKKAEVMFAALAPLAEAGFVENGQDKGGARVEARVLDAELKAAL